MKEIDLPPHDWKSERPKAPEPFFGAGWPVAASAIASIALATAFHESLGPIAIIGAIAGVVIAGLAQQIFS